MVYGNTEVMTKVYFIMGVSGCGKSTIGQLLANALEVPFFDGDDFHPQSNIDKMSQGIPLADEDRQPWLEAIHDFVGDHLKNQSLVVACSALKQIYRDTLEQNMIDQVQWIWLDGTQQAILKRLEKRADHFMPTALLQSQFQTLEPPQQSLQLNIEKSPAELVAEALNLLR